VVVVWEDGPGVAEIRLPATLAEGKVAAELLLEDGEGKAWTIDSRDLGAARGEEVEGTRFVAKAVPLPNRLPPGYHRLRLETAGRSTEALVIAAPRRVWAEQGRDWGVFIPLYALRSEGDWGVGDLTGLAELMGWVGELGGSVVATTPLLAGFLDGDEIEPSPYSPVSRLFWNELYLDVTRIPELERSSEARRMLESSAGQIKELRTAPLVDYRRAMASKRRVLEVLARSLWEESSPRRDDFEAFVGSRKSLRDYARFRALCERLRKPWPEWPIAARDGRIDDSEVGEETRRYHEYVQWLLHEQLEEIVRAGERAGVGAYLDLPVGVHRDGYDVWRERETFALDASTGAPPDASFIWGQDWGFPPPHPEGIRERGYAHLIETLRNLLRYAKVLRIDHIMGLHRLFWLPQGFGPEDGVYVRYEPQEVYAILALESHRSGTLIVGEDLGTVPPAVRSAMARHGVHRSYVVQKELTELPESALRPVRPDSAASLNTHDTATFASFWSGEDLGEAKELGVLGSEEARDGADLRERQAHALAAFLRRGGWLASNSEDPRSILHACLAFLAESPARFVIVGLEDLWLEPRRQNLPGMSERYPNWRRKARHALEEIRRLPEVVDTLAAVTRRRKGETA
jgi:4-alpha-glucanotransferase